MIVDGKALARNVALKLEGDIAECSADLALGVVVMNDSPVTAKYLARKKAVAEQVGVKFLEVSVRADETMQDVQSAVSALVADDSISGILVQLPLPSHIDTKAVLNLIPSDRDPDVLSLAARELFENGTGILPPVIEAMREILMQNSVVIRGKHAVVVGEGNLVGKPARIWLEHEGAEVSVVTEHTRDSKSTLRTADIVVCGAGVPGLIQPDMLKDGVVLLDAGTTDVGGSLSGDADPVCAEKCSIFTPVPGGIGPLTIVMIYKNLLTLAKQKAG